MQLVVVAVEPDLTVVNLSLQGNVLERPSDERNTGPVGSWTVFLCKYFSATFVMFVILVLSYMTSESLNTVVICFSFEWHVDMKRQG